MTEAEVLTDLQKVFDQVFLEPVRVTPELTAKEVPEWDSLLHISLMIAVERRFKIRFRVGEVEATQNVGQFARLITQRLAERVGG